MWSGQRHNYKTKQVLNHRAADSSRDGNGCEPISCGTGTGIAIIHAVGPLQHCRTGHGRRMSRLGNAVPKMLRLTGDGDILGLSSPEPGLVEDAVDGVGDGKVVVMSSHRADWLKG